MPVAATGTPPTTPTFAANSFAPVTARNRPITGDVVASARTSMGMSANVTGFSIAGVSLLLGLSEVALSLRSPADPTVVMGALVVKPDGTYTFTPALDYVGAAPAIYFFLRSADGQTATSAMTLMVLPEGESALAM